MEMQQKCVSFNSNHSTNDEEQTSATCNLEDCESENLEKGDMSSIIDSSSIEHCSGDASLLWNISATSSNETVLSDSFDSSSCAEYSVEPKNGPVSLIVKKHRLNTETLILEENILSLPVCDFEEKRGCSSTESVHNTDILMVLKNHIADIPCRIKYVKKDLYSVHEHNENSPIIESVSTSELQRLNVSAIELVENQIATQRQTTGCFTGKCGTASEQIHLDTGRALSPFNIHSHCSSSPKFTKEVQREALFRASNDSNVSDQAEPLEAKMPGHLKIAGNYVDPIRSLIHMGLDNEIDYGTTVDEKSDDSIKSTSSLLEMLTGEEFLVNHAVCENDVALTSIPSVPVSVYIEKQTENVKQDCSCDESNLNNKFEYCVHSQKDLKMCKTTFCNGLSQDTNLTSCTSVLSAKKDTCSVSVHQQISEPVRVHITENMLLVDTCSLHSVCLSHDTRPTLHLPSTRSTKEDDRVDVDRRSTSRNEMETLHLPKPHTAIIPSLALVKNTFMLKNIDVDNHRTCINENSMNRDQHSDLSLTFKNNDSTFHTYSVAHSPLLFSDEEDFEPDSSLCLDPLANSLPLQENKNINRGVTTVEQRRLHKIQGALVGVFPPPSVTTIQINVDDMLRLLKENHKLLSLKVATHMDNNTQNISSDFVQQVGLQNCDWPEAKMCSQLGFHYNHGTVSEELELLCQKFSQRYVGYETASSCNMWFTDGNDSSKKRNKKHGAGHSPGRRLSHLARRRKAFSKDNLLNNSGVVKSQPNALPERRQIVVENKKRNIFRKSGTSQIADEKYPVKAAGVMTHKRALFQSPDDSRKDVPTSKLNSGSKLKSIFNKTYSFKRALFGTSTKKNQSMSNESSESSIRRTTDQELLQGSESHHGKRSCDESRSSNQSKRKLVFGNSDDATTSTDRKGWNLKSSNMTKENMKMCRNSPSSSTSVTTKLLSSAHKKKLLWAVAESLRGQGIGMNHTLFRSCASALARLCRTFISEVIRTNTGSTSEVMLRLANQHVASIVKEKQKDKDVS